MAKKPFPRQHAARNETPSNAKKVAIETLNARLADGIDLALAVKQAHWNLKGPQFIAFHLILDGFRKELDGFNDDMPNEPSRCSVPACHGLAG